MRIAIFRADSFIGSQLVKELLTCGHEVIASGRRQPSIESNFDVHFVFCDFLYFDI
tara:strand:- start:277 stop:444 length:168 start_codon:yes stop_codon:yes gene_type:complete